MADLSVNIAGVSFQNPVIPASGTFGYGREYAKFYDIGRLGGISVKGTTLERREGNPPPRVAETPSGMLNSVGLQNPGVEHFIKEEIPYIKQAGTRIVANIAGSTPEDYAEMARRLDGTDVDMIELNISCPNVKCGGAAFGTDPKVAGSITRLVKDTTSKPVMVKLTPNVTDIALMAKAVEAEGADAVSLINTLLGMRIDIKTGRPILKNNVGGLSGPAVFPVAVRMVWQVANAVRIPVVGMGGIATWKDAVEMMMAGASAIQVGAALFTNPYAPVEIIDGLNRYLDENGIASVSEIVGTVQPW
ncbi:MAG: dihydroorotate dehydrogenase [Oscillospiraceae bacterium]|jgi:dihydroorotate dehydrogenase (NAD+) catalytic subunit